MFPLKKYSKFHGKFRRVGLTLTELHSVKLDKLVLKSAEYGNVTVSELNAVLTLLKKKFKKNTGIKLEVFAFLPLTMKPLEVRMGRGKGGKFRDNISPIKPGDSIVSIKGIPEILARNALLSAKKKIRLKCFVSKQYFF